MVFKECMPHFPSTEVRVEFTMNSYTANEADEAVNVCVRIVGGQLGIDIRLQLVTVSGTAVGEY